MNRQPEWKRKNIPSVLLRVVVETFATVVAKLSIDGASCVKVVVKVGIITSLARYCFAVARVATNAFTR